MCVVGGEKMLLLPEFLSPGPPSPTLTLPSSRTLLQARKSILRIHTSK